jgi:FkbM family methyltransferase
MEQLSTNTYHTKYGKITLLKNEVYIGNEFRLNRYWEEDTLIKLKQYIPSDRNILEIGAHCGTSSVVYSSYISENHKLFAYEPQNVMYQLLVQNITQNNLQDKIIPFNNGVFCYKGAGNMNNIDLDGGGGNVQRRYNEERHIGCNFGGIGLGKEGEPITLTTIDEMGHDNIGFIHCDAQGSENFIFSSGKETIKKNRPVILYENNAKYSKFLYDNVCLNYPSYVEESKFDLTEYCMTELKYSRCYDRFNGSIDTLLIP